MSSYEFETETRKRGDIWRRALRDCHSKSTARDGPRFDLRVGRK